jgi:hypothetical protein
MQEKLANLDEAPPPLALLELVTGHYISRALYVAAKLGIADLLHEGPQHSAKLAEATGTHAPTLHRVLLLLASAGVFTHTADGAFGLTPMGEYLRSGVPGSRRAQAILLAGPVQQRAWSGLLDIVKTGKTPSGKSAFEFFARHPEEAAIFNEGMTAAASDTAAAVAAAYDFSRFRTIVDVGGGHGELLGAILKTNSNLRGILFDMPGVAQGAREQMEAAGLGDRCSVASGDFFEAVPGGGDAYILKSVIHDWGDEQSRAILRNVHAAAAPNARLLLVELVVPARAERTAGNRIIAGSDVNMLVNLGGRERNESEFAALFEAAKFQLTRVVPTGSLWRVIEGVRVD